MSYCVLSLPQPALPIQENAGEMLSSRPTETLPEPMLEKIVDCLAGLSATVCTGTGQMRYQTTGPIQALEQDEPRSSPHTLASGSQLINQFLLPVMKIKFIGKHHHGCATQTQKHTSPSICMRTHAPTRTLLHMHLDMRTQTHGHRLTQTNTCIYVQTRTHTRTHKLMYI
ncbi:hypothetical protein SKAU_G00093170 [Synaphobranchus kaupii]|uniref:Uncharacterized protein n=1 Tax=Synaphobranchus kaupii TaxID=118154 RepID=A0A9Q1J6D7_SYNKA|nr:hypothetical protein SKAU_G00093170 [Synaphobranchus kaupii]